VDSITQAALGAAVGEAVLGKRLGNRALAWGALFGTLPDLDVVIAPFLDTAGMLWWHRGPSHSLLVMMVFSVLSGRWLGKLWKRDKVTPARAGWFVFLVWSTHVLIDCFTVYGTSVWWPFHPGRVALNNFFIIDPLFTAPLLVTLVWLAFLRTKKQLPKRRRLCVWGLALSAGYAALSFAAKHRASEGFGADLERRGISFERRMETPAPFNILLWRALVDRGGEFWIGYRSIFESRDAPVRWTIVAKGREAMDELENVREARVLDWFSDGWWVARRHKRGVWLADLRFNESRTWGARKDVVDLRPAFSWVIQPGDERDVLMQQNPQVEGAGGQLGRMVRRIGGNHGAWEGFPRLTGIHGSFPEPLDVAE
jgi:inner membrane protein